MPKIVSHPSTDISLASHDDDVVWHEIQRTAENIARDEPLLSALVADRVNNFSTLEEVLARHLAQKLKSDVLDAASLEAIFNEIFADDSTLTGAVRADIIATYQRDPACQNHFDVVFNYKGFLALTAYRLSHWLIAVAKRRALALHLQSAVAERFQIDIHPAAKIGQGIMIDHGEGVVIGETAQIGNDVSMFHGVTLGGSGKVKGRRHPTISDGVLISVGGKILGNITIGKCAKIGAGSVVIADVPPYATAVGVPARLILRKTETEPSQDMDHRFDNEL